MHKNAALAAAAAGACYCASLFDAPRAIGERCLRLARVCASVAAAVADEKITALRHGARTPELDARQAQRLFSLASRNGFLFHKLGQYASAHPNTPAAYRAVLSTLQDRMPARPLDLPALLHAELGVPFDALFAAIEPQPMACASIAQVHKAWLRDGSPVAVKLQHRELSRIAAADLAVMDGLFLGFHWAYPDTQYMRASWPEWRATLLRELDFHKEAEKGARVAAQFAGNARIHIPALLPRASSQRVLTMEFIQGHTVRELLEAAPGGLTEAQRAERRAIGHAASVFFAEQTLLHGFVHMDPHPANLMVRRRPEDGAWQLVVIDHGMCKQLDARFRRGFCALWRALLVQDDARARAASRALGLREEDAEALSQILTFRSTTSRARLGAEKTREEWERLRKEWEWVTPRYVNDFALRLPTDFAFVMRTMALARGINKSLGGSTRDRLACWGHAANAGLRLGQALGGEEAAAAGGHSPPGLPPTPPPLPLPTASEVLLAFGGAVASAFVPAAPPPPPSRPPPTDSEQLRCRDAAGAAGAGGLGALARQAGLGMRYLTGLYDAALLNSLLLLLDWLATPPSPAPLAQAPAEGAAGSPTLS